MQTARSQHAYETIKNAIESGEISPGSQLTEANLCAMLQMSRTPIREALNKLAAEGLAEYSAGRGYTAMIYTIDKIKMIYEKLEAVEGMLAYLVAEDKDSLDLVPLEEAVCKMEAALGQEDWDMWSKYDNSFHQIMYSYCKNEYITKDLEFLSRPSYHVRQMITRIYLDKSQSTEAHRNTYEAIKKGDACLARTVAQNHFRWVREQVIACMKQFNIK